eukprot:EG_transcript_3313
MSQHQLVLTCFHGPRYCTFCNEFIFGLTYQGFACTQCGIAIHKKCEAQANTAAYARCPGFKDENRPNKEFRGERITLKEFKTPCIFELFAEKCLLIIKKSSRIEGHKTTNVSIKTLKVVAVDPDRIELTYDSKCRLYRLENRTVRDSFLSCLANIKEAFGRPFPLRVNSASTLPSPSSSGNSSNGSNSHVSPTGGSFRSNVKVPVPGGSGGRLSPKAPPSPQPGRAPVTPSNRLSPKSPPSAQPPWDCKACTFANPPDKDACTMCATKKGSSGPRRESPSRPLPSAPPLPASSSAEGPWVCEVCTLRNPATLMQCSACLAPCRSKDPNFNNDAEIQKYVQAQKDLLQLLRAGRLTQGAYQKMAQGLQASSSKPGHPGAASPAAVKDAFELPQGVSESVLRQWYDWDTKRWMEEHVQVVVDWQPLAQGNLRVAVRMLDLSRPKGQRACVAKYLKPEHYDPKEGDQQYFVDVEMQAHCRAVADAFNAARPPKEVSFLEAWVICRSGNVLPNQRVLAAEPYIDPTSYLKHNNNWGFVHPLARNTPQAFSHFSWEYTQHRFMIVDIQGVGDVYTDPQIHSADDDGTGKGPWGMGNCGMEGINKFLETHHCNAVCRALGIARPSKAAVAQPTTSSGTQVPLRDNRSTPAWNFKLHDFIRDLRPVRDGITLEDLSLLKMEMEEFNHIVDLFNGLDKDGNGVLTPDEVVAMLSRMDSATFAFNRENTQYLLQLAQSSEISFKQFLLWYKGVE